MSVREVLKMGDARLLQPAAGVDDMHAPEITALLEDMFDTMRQRAGVGLAAPQIGVSLRVVIFGFKDNPRYPDAPEVAQTVHASNAKQKASMPALCSTNAIIWMACCVSDAHG